MTAIAQTAAVPAAPPQRAEQARFCSRCAITADEPDAQSYGSGRVCERCGMGVMLSAPREALPPSAAAFVVVTREGKISAVSEHAEELVGNEAGLLGVPMTTALTSPEDETRLVRLIARAAGGGRDITRVSLIPAAAPSAGSRGRLSARIAGCGPPRAALLVLERAPL